MAGGAVLRALLGTTPRTCEGDLDLFIVADDEATARATYDRVLRHLAGQRRPANNAGNNNNNNNNSITHHQLLVVRSAFAVTFAAAYPQRNLQLILRRHACTADVIFNFDVDCCQVAWDGKRVLATPSAHRALRTGVNLADPERSSIDYEMRLAKFAQRGFKVAVPGLDLARVQSKYRGNQCFTVQDRQLKHVELEFKSGEDKPSAKVDSKEIVGLSKLLVYSKLAIDELVMRDRTGEVRDLQQRYAIGDTEPSEDNYLIDAAELSHYSITWRRPTPPNPPPFRVLQDFIPRRTGTDSVGGPLLPFFADLNTPADLFDLLKERTKTQDDILQGMNTIFCCYDLLRDVRQSMACRHVEDATRQFRAHRFRPTQQGRGVLPRHLEFPTSARTGTNPWLRLPESDWPADAYGSSESSTTQS